MTQVPENLKYTSTHEWLDKEANEVRVGITDHAQQLLGDLVFIELPDVGKTVSAGDELGVLESVKAAADFYAPISGVVIAVNQDVTDNPALLNDDPYGKAWLVKLSINHNDQIEQLLNAEQYSASIEGDH